MKLENLVMTELESIDLNGLKIIHLSCKDETLNISFKIADIKIDFIAKNEEDFQVTALTHADQVYSDEATLSKGNDWAKYLLTIINPIIKKHQSKLTKAIKVLEAEVDEARIDEPTVIEPEVKILNERIEKSGAATDQARVDEFKTDESVITAESKEILSNEDSEIEITTELTHQGSIGASKIDEPIRAFRSEGNVSNESIEEAVEKGRKEAYKAARKKNIEEIKKLRKKYHLILLFTIIFLVGGFIVFWHFYGSEDTSQLPTDQEVYTLLTDTD